MDNIFITKIHIDKYRNINNLDIELSQDSRKHLIITGKNGSGKTSLLDLIVDNFGVRDSLNIEDFKEFMYLYDVNDYKHFDTNTKNWYYSKITSLEPVGNILFSNDATNKNVLMIGLPSEHLFHVSNAPILSNIKDRYSDNLIYNPRMSVYQNMLQTMVTMRIQLLEAKDNNDEQLYIQSEKWFNILNRVLHTIYEEHTIELKYIPKEYTYKLIINNYEFDLNQMADGFSAFFRIVSEIMEKMDYYTNYKCDYTLPGIAFIDELETHMHISMQKMALSFLTEMFPNIQFIVTTHSPFVISSLENALVYDLSKRESLENPHQYSYESIIEGYYDIDMYSQKMKEKFNRYKKLAFIERSVEENKEFSKLRIELQSISPAQKELYMAFQDIENKRNKKDNG